MKKKIHYQIQSVRRSADKTDVIKIQHTKNNNHQNKNKVISDKPQIIKEENVYYACMHTV